jgi:urease accessory protein
LTNPKSNRSIAQSERQLLLGGNRQDRTALETSECLDLKIQNPKSNWQGCLDLVYGNCDGTTQVLHAYAKAPLKVQRPFYPEGREICHTVTLHTAGGIVGSDRLSCTVRLQPHSRALMTTAAATKVYRSNGQQARQTTEIHLEEGTVLEWLPQETIVFDGAMYRQDLRVELAPGANFLGWEMTRFGRSARGEKFLQGEWRSRWEIWQRGNPVWIDRQWLPGCEDTFYSPNGLAGQPLVGTLIYIGQPVSEETIEQVRNLIDPPLTRGESRTGQVGVTRTQGQGLLCRYRGSSTAEVKHWFMEIWRLLRLSRSERPAIQPRVWQW